MSIDINKPKNTNFLKTTKFLVNFSLIGDTTYFCQKVNIPGISITELPHATPNLDLYVPGTKISYGTFDMSFLVNEDLSSWLSIHKWMRQLTTDMKYKPKTNGQATLTILSNLNNPKMRFKFVNIFPLSLSDIEFDTTEESQIVSNASFRFDYFDVETIT